MGVVFCRAGVKSVEVDLSGFRMRWFNGCVVSSDFCLSWDAWSLRCVSSRSTSVSSCKCCTFLSFVDPVAILRAVFCMR